MSSVSKGRFRRLGVVVVGGWGAHLSSSVAIHFSILSLALELINACGPTATSHDKMDDWRFMAEDALLPLCSACSLRSLELASRKAAPLKSLHLTPYCVASVRLLTPGRITHMNSNNSEGGEG